jgi:hypothetical protein
MAENPNRAELKTKGHKVPPRNYKKQSNAGLQLRRAISIQAERKKLLEKHAIAPSAARLCSMPALQTWVDFAGWSLRNEVVNNYSANFDFLA